jgi:hypothetical protein
MQSRLASDIVILAALLERPAVRQAGLAPLMVPWPDRKEAAWEEGYQDEHQDQEAKK